jgi:hypothetical protein
MKCDRRCFECKYPDCICDGISVMERVEQMQRDINTQTEEFKGKYANKRAKKNFGHRGMWYG